MYEIFTLWNSFAFGVVSNKSLHNQGHEDIYYVFSYNF